MKQKLLFLIVMLAFLLPARLSAFNYKYEGVTLRYEVIDEEAKTCKVSGYKDFSGDLVIPDVANDGTADYKVTVIGKEAFKDCEDMTSVVIGNSVTSIGEYAFYWCSGLTSVVIPNSVTSIGNDAFRCCRGLISVVIPNSVTSIGDRAFSECSGLIKSAYPSIFKRNPFYNGLAVAYNPDGAIIEDGWIWGPDKSAIYFVPYNFEGEYSIPESVTSIGESAFNGCSGLTSLVIPNSVTEIRAYAFRRCSGLTSVEIPNSVTSIEGDVFNCCSGLTSVVIPNSVTSIGSSAFSGCSGLTSVVIGNSVETIGENAFESCSGLTSVVIPNSVTSIGNWAFRDCSGLTSVVIPNSVQTIGWSAFSGCSGLTSVVIPNSVTSIGDNAFNRCNGITYLEFNAENCESINSYNNPVFPNSLETIVFGDKVTTIPQYLFSNCEKLNSVKIPNSVKSINMRAFSGCSGLTSLVIGNSVASIGSFAFSGCRGLTSVVIPNSVSEIDRAAFHSCNLDTIIMGCGIKNIESDAFGRCPASKIYITAQTPPEIQSTTFDNYKGMLYIQGQAAVNAYDDDKYWGNFNNELMTVPTALEIEGLTSISGNAGDTFRIKAKMTPEDVTLPYILWRSTNPKIATVDHNGVVTLQEYSAEELTRAEGDEDNDGTCKIIAESLYFDGPIAEITVNNTGISGVEAVIDRNDNSIDYSLPYNVYNMNGFKVAETTEGLATGIYIIRQGRAAVKTVVK